MDGAPLPPRDALTFNTSTHVGVSPAELFALADDLERLQRMDPRLRDVRWISRDPRAAVLEVRLDIRFLLPLITRVVGEQQLTVERLSVAPDRRLVYHCEGSSGSGCLEAVVSGDPTGSLIELAGWVRAWHGLTNSLLGPLRPILVVLITRSLHRTVRRAADFITADGSTLASCGGVPSRRK
jgi:hypothetical protein